MVMTRMPGSYSETWYNGQKIPQGGGMFSGAMVPRASSVGTLQMRPWQQVGSRSNSSSAPSSSTSNPFQYSTSIDEVPVPRASIQSAANFIRGTSTTGGEPIMGQGLTPYAQALDPAMLQRMTDRGVTGIAGNQFFQPQQTGSTPISTSVAQPQMFTGLPVSGAAQGSMNQQLGDTMRSVGYKAAGEADRGFTDQFSRLNLASQQARAQEGLGLAGYLANQHGRNTQQELALLSPLLKMLGMM